MEPQHGMVHTRGITSRQVSWHRAGGHRTGLNRKARAGSRRARANRAIAGRWRGHPALLGVINAVLHQNPDAERMAQGLRTQKSEVPGGTGREQGGQKGEREDGTHV